MPEILSKDDRRYEEDSKRYLEALHHEGAIWEDAWFEQEGKRLLREMVPDDLRDEREGCRFLLVKNPTPNAFAIYSGDIFFHTGLISRFTHPDQIRFVAAHELSHWRNRDALYFAQSLKKKTIAAQLIDLAVTPVGAAFGLGALAELSLNVLHVSSVTGFSRDQESRSDQEAVNAMLASPFDAERSTETFLIFMAESEKFDQGAQLSFLLSHPSNERRLADVKAVLEKQSITPSKEVSLDEAFVRDTRHIRIENVLLNIRHGFYYNAVDDAKILLRIDPEDLDALTLKGDAYREMTSNFERVKDQISQEWWSEQFKDMDEDAVIEFWREQSDVAYEAALVADPSFAKALRGQGLLYADWSSAPEHRQKAVRCLKAYLNSVTGAPDRRFIDFKIRKMEEDK
ncbi:MAG: M48 family metalloprotease [bacterium]|nr:M48 family metalloprotease [bacterium]